MKERLINLGERSLATARDSGAIERLAAWSKANAALVAGRVGAAILGILLGVQFIGLPLAVGVRDFLNGLQPWSQGSTQGNEVFSLVAAVIMVIPGLPLGYLAIRLSDFIFELATGRKARLAPVLGDSNE